MSTLSVADAAYGEAEVPLLDDVRAVTEDVWTALVGTDEVLVPRVVPAGASLEAAGVWSAVVTVSGGWQGVVTVELEESVARALTAGMLAIPDGEEVGDSDLADAVGELVNMIGGNVKSLMPGPSALSLPSVAAGRSVFASDVVEACRVDVSWRGEPVRVCVHVPA